MYSGTHVYITIVKEKRFPEFEGKWEVGGIHWKGGRRKGREQIIDCQKAL